ncbi:MAG: cytochrome c biogenesis protein ResB [Opitutales bacterium]|nr:cytochrome c biogenesis protein ResB [Opitutales bacterium]
MKARILRRAYLMLSSPRLTLVLLIYSVLLIFVATLAQREIGIAHAQAIYFEGFFGMGKIAGVSFPFIGGAVIGILSVVNIVLSAMRFCKFGVQGLGVSITHMSLALLIISGGLQYFLRIEGSVVLKPSQTTDIVVIRNSTSQIKKLPFTITLLEFKEEKWSGSSIAKSYSSDIVFKRGETSVRTKTSMNNPASFAGWTFYQMSYGKDGSSVLGAVKNPARLLPWLSVGATFFGMMIIFLPRVFRKGNRYEK